MGDTLRPPEELEAQIAADEALARRLQVCNVAAV